LLRTSRAGDPPHIERLPAASEHWDVHPDDSDESILTEAAHYPVFLVE